jgi:lysophospholipase L1-like esterase
MHIRLGRFSVVLLMPFFISFCSSPPRGFIVLCAGDSITAEAYPHFLQRIFARDGIRARVLNYGRSGFTSGEYRALVEKNLDRLAREHPDAVLLQLGTNDVRVDGDRTPTGDFVTNMRAITAAFRTFRSRSGRPPIVMLATIPPVPRGTPLPFSDESVRRVEEDINPAVRSLAEEEVLPLVDNHELFLSRPELLPGIHPSREGYRALAENWYSGLRHRLGAGEPLPTAIR